MQSYSASEKSLRPSGKNCFAERAVPFEDNMAVITSFDNEVATGKMSYM